MVVGERLEFPKSPRTRRSHAERAAETQARIKAAVVDAIMDVGFQRTTASEISRRSGVSWGAAQHHYGDKSGILTAILVDSFNLFAAGLSEISVEGKSLDDRVSLFIDAAWKHFGSGHYRSTFEILLNLPSIDWSSPDHALRDATLDAWGRVWGRFFDGADLPPRRTAALQYYAISVMSGLAAMKKLEGPSPSQRRMELGFLKETLARELVQSGKQGGPR